MAFLDIPRDMHPVPEEDAEIFCGDVKAEKATSITVEDVPEGSARDTAARRDSAVSFVFCDI